MIDLARTKRDLLADIGATHGARASLVEDAGDSRFQALEEACLVVCGGTPQEILPAVEAALTRRFADVAEKRLEADLLYLLKKGVGNAYKWGNEGDPARSIEVRIVVTPAGAVACVTDQGAGFDVERTLDRLRCGECYYTHGGSGFKNFERTRSVISYADRGRTLLIRFLVPGSCDDEKQRSLGVREGKR